MTLSREGLCRVTPTVTRDLAIVVLCSLLKERPNLVAMYFKKRQSGSILISLNAVPDPGEDSHGDSTPFDFKK